MSIIMKKVAGEKRFRRKDSDEDYVENEEEGKVELEDKNPGVSRRLKADGNILERSKSPKYRRSDHQ